MPRPRRAADRRSRCGSSGRVDVRATGTSPRCRRGGGPPAGARGRPVDAARLAAAASASASRRAWASAASATDSHHGRAYPGNSMTDLSPNTDRTRRALAGSVTIDWPPSGHSRTSRYSSRSTGGRGMRATHWPASRWKVGSAPKSRRWNHTRRGVQRSSRSTRNVTSCVAGPRTRPPEACGGRRDPSGDATYPLAALAAAQSERSGSRRGGVVTRGQEGRDSAPEAVLCPVRGDARHMTMTASQALRAPRTQEARPPRSTGRGLLRPRRNPDPRLGHHPPGQGGLPRRDGDPAGTGARPAPRGVVPAAGRHRRTLGGRPRPDPGRSHGEVGRRDGRAVRGVHRRSRHLDHPGHVPGARRARGGRA